MDAKKFGIAMAAAVTLGAGVVGGAAIAAASGGGDTQQRPYGAVRAGPGGEGFGGAPHQHTQVLGDELATVKAAVKAKDADVTVLGVRKDPDGSYDVLGKRDDRPVMLEVSKDLKTITERTGGPRGDEGAPPAPPET